MSVTELVSQPDTSPANPLLEAKGARTAFVTCRGFKDILHIGRQAREQLYSLCPQPVRQLIPRELCFEVDSRVDANGNALVELSHKDIEALKAQLSASQVEAVAVCLLFSFLNNKDERQLEESLKNDFFVTTSSNILPEQREYERGIVTWLNSYLGPITEQYLTGLQQGLAGRTVHVMQSDATTLPAIQAAKQSVRLLLSGPAGGVVGAQFPFV